MVNRIKRILETVLISAVVFVAIDSTKKHIPTDLRDAVRDTGSLERSIGVSLSEINSNVSNPAVLVVKSASNRAAYLKDAEGEKDVFISEIYTDKKLVKKAMAASVKSLESEGKRILFASLLKETAGGDFYVIRLDNSQAAPLQAAVTYSKDDVYLKTLQKAADSIENTCRETWQ